MPLDPKMPADDRAKAAMGLDPGQPSVTPTAKAPPEGAAGSAADTPNPSGEEETDRSFIVRNGLKGRKK